MNVRAARPFRPALEVLEGRMLPATFTVVDLGDGGTGSGLEGDLRYCIEAANANSAPSNRIVFQPGLTGTITLQQGQLQVDKNLKIDGPGADLLTISGNHQSGVLEITADPRAQKFRMEGVTIADGIGVVTSFGRRGGGLRNSHADVTLTNCVFSGNVVGGVDALGYGGAIDSVAGTVALTNCTLADNHGDNTNSSGGGIYLENGALSLDHCTLSGNSAASMGGALDSLSGTVTATDTIMTGNSAQFGGAMNGGRSTTCVRCTITDNSALSAGAVSVPSGTFIDCTIANNVAITGAGGGFEGAAQLSLIGSTIAGNRAGLDGGGVYWVGGLATITDCTFSDNSAPNGFGAGIFIAFGASLELTSGTLTQNSGLTGGGLFVGDPSSIVLVRNTILAGNQARFEAADVLGAVLSLGHNLVGEVDGSSGWQATDLTGTSDRPLDPRLGPLQDNGGPTWTHAPFANSPAIDHGDPVLVDSQDQRGTFRFFDVLNSGLDIGAVDAEDAVAFRVILPDHVTAGQPFALTAVAVDQWGNVATLYAGTVHFDSTDQSALLPDNYSFASADQGQQTFAVTLNTRGSQAVRVTDVNSASLSVTANTIVDDPCPPFFAIGDLDGTGLQRRAQRWWIRADGFESGAPGH
jgi:hypothetical protein